MTIGRFEIYGSTFGLETGAELRVRYKDHEAEVTRLTEALATARADGLAQGLRMAAEVAAQEGWPGTMSADEYNALSASDEAAMDCAGRIEANILALIPAPREGGEG